MITIYRQAGKLIVAIVSLTSLIQKYKLSEKNPKLGLAYILRARELNPTLHLIRPIFLLVTKLA